MMKKNLVDVIIPSFNRAPTLDRALSSVHRQSFQDFVLWVVDDGSADSTPAVLKRWQKVFPSDKMKCLRQNRHGVSSARNHALKNSQSPWVAFLDSDDEWLENKLEEQITWMQKHPEHPLIHTDEIWIRKGKKVQQQKKHLKKGGRVFIHNLPLCRISPSSAMIQRAFLNSLGGWFREDFPVCEDYELWLRITSRTEVGFIPSPLIIKYGGHADQLSQKYHSMDAWRVRAMSSHLNSPYLHPAEKRELVKTLRKKCQILLKGYRKYNNYHSFHEINSICRSLCFHE